MSIAAAATTSPFKGLAAFTDSDLDALFFFGREREREVLVANLLASRLTVLYGESGVGKSSLLAAAVVRNLRATAPAAVITLLGTWSELADDALAGINGASEAYLILDQFEEYFLYHGDAAERGSLLHELPDLLHDSRVNVLIAVREDSLARLDTLKSRIPSVFANQVRLEHLDRNAARRAILGPIDRWNEVAPDERVGVESALVEAVLDECAVEGSDRIEAPYLQLVLERMWERERREGSSVLRLETLNGLGGARTIVREHLHGALALLDSEEQDVASSMFEHLVTPSGTKIAHRASDLAEYAHVPEETLRHVLTTLTRDRILHSVDGSDRYEIFHDVLAEPIRGWRLQRRLDRERLIARKRQRRLLTLVALSLCALVGVGLLAVWALSERGTARSQARHAHARELEATALQQLALDPNHGVRLALEAARLEQGVAAETVLRQALIADRLRLVKHTDGPVRAVATSPRGDLVAAALPGGEVVLLNSRNRRLVRRFVVPRKVASLAFGQGGRTLVSASPVGLAQIWDLSTGKRVAATGPVVAARTPDGGLRLVRLEGLLAREIPHVRRLSAAPDGSAVAATIAQPDGRVRTWLFDAHDRLVRVLARRGVRDVAFSPDGRLVATGTADGLTILWNSHTGRWVRTLFSAKSGVDVVAFSPDGTLLASGGDDLRVWDVATGVRRFLLFGHTNPITALAWSPDGSVLASGSADRTAILYRISGLPEPGSTAAILAGMGAAVRTLAFSRDGAELITGGDDHAVRFWDARPDEELEVLGHAGGPALAARWAGSTVVGLWRGVIQTYDTRTRRPLHALRPVGGGAFTALGVARDGVIVAAGTDAGATIVWEGRTGRRLGAHRGGAPITAVSVSPNGDLVASGDSGGALHVWKARGGSLWFREQQGPVTDVAFSRDGSEIITAGQQGVVVWSARNGRRLHALMSPAGATAATFSPDGRLIAAAGLDDNARIWFARSGSLYRVLRGHTKPLTDVEFSADGSLLATAGRDSDVRVWGVAKGLGHVLQRRAFGPVSSVAFDPSGRWVAAAAPISVIIWSANGRQLFYVRGHKAVLTGVSFAPDSATVLSSSRDGTIRTYRCAVCVSLSTLVHMAEVQLARTR